jgi:hypothetical protein
VGGQAPTHITTNGACAENDEVHASALLINGRQCTGMVPRLRIVRRRALAAWRRGDGIC